MLGDPGRDANVQMFGYKRQHKRRDRGKSHTEHMDHISEKGYVSVVHKPIAVKSGDEHSGCQSRSRQRVGQVEKSTGLGRQESQTQVSASLMDLCHLKHSRACETSQETRRESPPPRGHRHRRRWIQSSIRGAKEHQLREWQRQNSCIQMPNSLAWLERTKMQYQPTRRCICQTPPDNYDCQRMSVHKYGYDHHPVEDRNSGIRFEEPVGPLERNLHGHPLLWERKTRRSTCRTTMRKRVPTWEGLHVHPQITNVLFHGM